MGIPALAGRHQGPGGGHEQCPTGLHLPCTASLDGRLGSETGALTADSGLANHPCVPPPVLLPPPPSFLGSRPPSPLLYFPQYTSYTFPTLASGLVRPDTGGYKAKRDPAPEARRPEEGSGPSLGGLGTMSPKTGASQVGNPQAAGTECSKAQRTRGGVEEQATEGPRLSCTAGSLEAGDTVEGYPEHM